MTSTDPAEWEPLVRRTRDGRTVIMALGLFTAGVATGLAIDMLVVHGSELAWVEVGLAALVMALVAGTGQLVSRRSGRRWVKHRPRLRTRIRRLNPRVRRPKPTGVVRVKRR